VSTAGHEHGKTFAGLVIEVVLITIGVFLALLASNWHEDREHRAQARAALRNFIGEMQANEQAVKQYRAYHETLARELDLFLKSIEPMTNERMKRQVHFEGVRPVIFEHTAWDLALATQALSHVEPRLAFQISTVYTKQNAFQTLENSFLSSAFTPAGFSSDNPKGLATAIWTYLGDVNHEEPLMLNLYAKTIPEIRRALTGTSAPQ
jgi:Tfp pilus assembly protein PilE